MNIFLTWFKLCLNDEKYAPSSDVDNVTTNYTWNVMAEKKFKITAIRKLIIIDHKFKILFRDIHLRLHSRFQNNISTIISLTNLTTIPWTQMVIFTNEKLPKRILYCHSTLIQMVCRDTATNQTGPWPNQFHLFEPGQDHGKFLHRGPDRIKIKKNLNKLWPSGR